MKIKFFHSSLLVGGFKAFRIGWGNTRYKYLFHVGRSWTLSSSRYTGTPSTVVIATASSSKLAQSFVRVLSGTVVETLVSLAIEGLLWGLRVSFATFQLSKDQLRFIMITLLLSAGTCSINITQQACNINSGCDWKVLLKRCKNNELVISFNGYRKYDSSPPVWI